VIFLCWLLNCICVLLSVAFFTLFERKVMGLFHLRFGPNKVFFIGVVQPLLDAFKLLTKQTITPLKRNKLVYGFSPILALTLSLFVWLCLPFSFTFVCLPYSFLLFFLVASSVIFSVLLSGWSSNSKYSLIGSLRSVAQSISYEPVLSTLLIFILILFCSYSIQSRSSLSRFFLLLFFPPWFICTLAETHRAPFDFSESESELVSGFNTEYSGAYFAFIFLSEYSFLLFSCFLVTFVFFSWFLPVSFFSYTLLSLLISFTFIWVRVTYCRFRYDLLMNFSWKFLLPGCLSLFILSLFIFV
jgi:NADH-ubiquinone oxidoreductase chain 1